MDVINPDFAANSAFIQYIVYGSCKNIDEAIKQYQEEMLTTTAMTLGITATN